MRSWAWLGYLVAGPGQARAWWCCARSFQRVILAHSRDTVLLGAVKRLLSTFRRALCDATRVNSFLPRLVSAPSFTSFRLHFELVAIKRVRSVLALILSYSCIALGRAKFHMPLARQAAKLEANIILGLELGLGRTRA